MPAPVGCGLLSRDQRDILALHFVSGQCVSDTADTVEIEALLPISASDTVWKGDIVQAAAQMDDEHLELAAREKEFSDAVDREASRAELEIRLTQLIEGFQNHFDSEEGLMQATNFPGNSAMPCRVGSSWTPWLRNSRSAKLNWGSGIRLMVSSPVAADDGLTRRCAPGWPSACGNCAATGGPRVSVRGKG